MNGGYSAESEARAMAAGLGIGPDRIEQPIGVLSGGERRRVELSRILFAGSDILCLDEPTNHLDVDAKEWLMGFLRQYRGALLVISHDLDLLDEAITRVLHLDRPGRDGHGSSGRVQGHLLPVHGRPGRRRGASRQDGGASGQGDRTAAGLRRSVRRQGDEGGPGPQCREAHRPAGVRQGRRAPGGPHDAGAFPRPADSWSHGDRGDLDVQGLRRAAGLRGRQLRPRPRRAAARARPQRCRARRRCCGSWRARPTPTSATSGSVTRWRSATTPRSTTTSTRRPRSWTTSVTRCRSASTCPRPSCGVCSACSGCRGTRSSRTPARCRAARRPSWRWRC